MGLLSDLKSDANKIFSESWNETDAQKVPAATDLRLSHDARHFAAVLYADLSGSTNLVDNYGWQVAGEIYKTYLHCAGKVIRSLDGDITAYDSDRIMAVFIGDDQTTNAAKCGLQLNWAVNNILNPALKTQYTTTDYVIKQVVGIETSEIRAARTGVRGDNDLVWIGKAANHAAKLTD
jgi:class 3 adenylate cyclase